jgi:hypothetical protein
MTRFRTASLAALAGFSMLAMATAPASAAPCRDAHGRFAKCGTVAATVPHAAARPAAHAAATPLTTTHRATHATMLPATNSKLAKAPAAPAKTRTAKAHITKTAKTAHSG